MVVVVECGNSNGGGVIRGHNRDGGGGCGRVEDVAMAMGVAVFEDTVVMEEVVVGASKYGK